MRRSCKYGLPLLLLLLMPLPALALLPAHNDYGTCLSLCHDLHGGSVDGLLKGINSEATCLACHGPLGVATKKATVHNPLGLTIDDQGYITCRECHDAHDNVGSNVFMVGYDYDPATGQDFDDNVPRIRFELPAGTSLETPVYRNVTFTDLTEFNIDGTFPGPGACQICHDPNHNIGLDCTTCHPHVEGFSGGDCTTCHDGFGGGALSVGPGSSHSETATGYTCEECHVGHDAGTINVPNNSTVGILYESSGHNGISLGSGTVTGATEAEICWNCHDSHGISEWGANTDTNGAASDYDFGGIFTDAGTTTPTSNWIGAWWKSATPEFAYKTEQIQSTHSVDGTATVPGLDPVDTIRCSWCHDVHDTFGGATTDGAPYLRGTWMGSPYREDGAPFAAQTYAPQGSFGAVPRGGTGATELGGYQIDQNNASPTSTWTLADSAGLCTLCHGTDVDNMNEFDVDEAGDPQTAAQSWVGINGHSNAVLGGTGTNASNIFREDWRKPTPVTVPTEPTPTLLPDGYCDPNSSLVDVDGRSSNSDSYCAGYPNMAYQQLFFDGNDDGENDLGAIWGSGFRGSPSLGAQGFWVEPTIGANQPFAYEDYNWGATVDKATIDSQYHKFSCSKCHNPHASRLPRLMITNCLDLEHNTWGETPLTMTKEDTAHQVRIQCPDCGTGIDWTGNIEFIDIDAEILYFPSSVFGADYNRADYTITWNGVDYNYNRSDLANNASVTIRGTAYTFDTAEVSALDIQAWIGKGIPSELSFNDAGLSRISIDSSGRTITRGTSAQNCHRYISNLQNVSGTNISFEVGTGSSGRDQILDGDSQLGVFVVGSKVRIEGSLDNDGIYDVLAVGAGFIEVASGSFTGETAGASVTVSSINQFGWNLVTPW